MVKIFKVFLADLRRIRANVVAIVIVMGLCVIPALYAWFNIMSNWDPYGKAATSGMKVAVCSEDRGAEISGMAFNVGDKVISGLKENNAIGWVFTDSKKDALEGVNSGEYYAALVIPKDFTGDMISFLGGEPANPSIGYYENSKKNAIATKITGKAKSSVQDEINETFISTLTSVLTETGKMLSQSDEEGVDVLSLTVEKLDDIDQNLQTYVDILDSFALVTNSASDLAESAQNMIVNTQGFVNSGQDTVGSMQSSVLSGAQTAQTVSTVIEINLDTMDQNMEIVERQVDKTVVGSSLQDVRSSVKEAKSVMESTLTLLKDLVGENDRHVKALQKSYEKLEEDVITLDKDGIATAKTIKKLRRTLSSDIRECRKNLKSIRSSFRYQIHPKLTKTILNIENSLLETGMLLNNVESSFGDINTALESYQTTLDSGTDDIAATVQFVKNLQTGVHKLRVKLEKLDQNKQYNEMIRMLKNDPELMAAFVSSPVEMESKKVYPIETYGSAMAAFYSVLAIWVGALILVALIHVKVKPEKGLEAVRPGQAYFGRYILFFLIGQAQTLIIVLGDLFYVKIQCVHPFLFWLSAAVCSLVFTLFIYSLTAAMGNVGEAIAVVVMVIQVAGAGGTFPIEVLPEIYQRIYRFLPFTYGMNAMRECVGGRYKDDYWTDIRMLGVYILVSLFIGLVLAIPFRRLNRKIEKSKERSKVML